MLDRMRALFGGERHAQRDEAAERDRLQLAAAALMVEGACSDGDFDESERNLIRDLLRDRFGLSAMDASELVEEGHKAVVESSETYGFTRVLKDELDADERIRVIEMLWEVAYADGHVHHYEANLVRRVAGLLFVADRDSGAARKRVEQRMRQTVQPPR